MFKIKTPFLSKFISLAILISLSACTPNITNSNSSFSSFPISLDVGKTYLLEVQAPESTIKFVSKLEITRKLNSETGRDGVYISSEATIGGYKARVSERSNINGIGIIIFVNPKAVINLDGSVYERTDSISCDLMATDKNSYFTGESSLQEDLPKGICALSEINSSGVFKENSSIVELRQEFTNERLLGTLNISKASVKLGETWKITAIPPNQSSPITFTATVTSPYKKLFDDSVNIAVAEVTFPNGLGYVTTQTGFYNTGGLKSTYERGYANFTFFLNPSVIRTVDLLGKNGNEKYISCSADFFESPTSALDGRVYATTGKEDYVANELRTFLPYGECSVQKIK